MPKKRPSPVREIWRRIFSLDKASFRTRSLRSTSSWKRHSLVKKREKNLKIENLSKISTAQTVFHLQFLSIEKLYVLKKERNCKDSVSSIVKFIEWTWLHASVQRLRHFYSSKRKRKKEKRERRKRTVERHFFVWCFPVGLILPVFQKKKEKKKELFLKFHYLLNHRILKFCYILNAPLCWNLLVVFFPLSIWLLLHVSCLSLIPLSLILANVLLPP